MNIREIRENVLDFITRRETISVALLVVFIFAALASIFISPQMYQRSIHEGDIALKDIYAPYDFVYEWELDEEKTQEAKQKALEEVPFVIKRSVQAEAQSIDALSGFFNTLEEEKNKEIPIEAKITNISEFVDARLTDRDIQTLLDYGNLKKLKNETINIAENIFLIGLVSSKDMNRINQEKSEEAVIYNETDGTEIKRKPRDLLDYTDKKKLNSTVEGLAYTQLKGDRRLVQVVSELVEGYTSVNLEIDEKRTKELREKRIRNAGPVYKTWSVRKNELIVEKGMRINSRHIAQITQMRNIFSRGKPILFFIGVVLLFLLLGLVGAIYLYFMHRTNLLHYTKKISIILLCLLFTIIVADFVIRLPQPSYFIPMASMSMLVILLVDFNSAFLATMLMSILVGVLTGGKLEITFALLVGSIVGMYKVKDARRRADILRAGLWIGLAKFIAIACMGFVSGVELKAILNDGFWGLASGVVSGFVVMGLLPLFEHGFKVATNISLLELSDLNHPLLKKLSLEAPGTYHHSIMVGNLAEAACDAIGANSLLARVGSYYHDIGKIQKAEYFSENEMGAGSKHKNLAPSMSALIIAKHVKDGVDVAKKHKMNTAIVDFIGQHHGDSLIYFFYQKALEKLGKDQKIKENDFRYPGPRPQTKETAIVLLADAVEAASRSLEEPTPSSIRNLVKKIINNKFIDGQLDECELTLKDMHNIADSFVRVLTGIYHTRLSYPDEKKNGSGGMKLNGNKNKSGKQKPKKKD